VLRTALRRGRAVSSRLFSDFDFLPFRLHQLGEFFPAQPVFVHMIASGEPFDIAFAESTQLRAIGFHVDFDVFIKDEFAVDA
jgi:hypothetical protein